MGRKARIKPRYLAEKLRYIRKVLKYSQGEMLRRLGLDDVIDYRRISEFELGNNEPPLPVLLQYARLAGVPVDDLIDDDAILPKKLPGNFTHYTPERRSLKRRNMG